MKFFSVLENKKSEMLEISVRSVGPDLVNVNTDDETPDRVNGLNLILLLRSLD